MDENELEWDIEDRDARLESGELLEEVDISVDIIVGADE